MNSSRTDTLIAGMIIRLHCLIEFANDAGFTDIRRIKMTEYSSPASSVNILISG